MGLQQFLRFFSRASQAADCSVYEQTIAYLRDVVGTRPELPLSKVCHLRSGHPPTLTGYRRCR